MSRADKKAFPGGVNQNFTSMNIEPGEPTQEGMTLLEYASIEAMKGFCANPDPGLVVVSVERRAELSVKQARALMAELEKQS